jgi:hypothetical protein
LINCLEVIGSAVDVATGEIQAIDMTDAGSGSVIRTISQSIDYAVTCLICILWKNHVALQKYDIEFACVHLRCGGFHLAFIAAENADTLACGHGHGETGED